MRRRRGRIHRLEYGFLVTAKQACSRCTRHRDSSSSSRHTAVGCSRQGTSPQSQLGTSITFPDPKCPASHHDASHSLFLMPACPLRSSHAPLVSRLVALGGPSERVPLLPELSVRLPISLFPSVDCYSPTFGCNLVALLQVRCGCRLIVVSLGSYGDEVE